MEVHKYCSRGSTRKACLTRFNPPLTSICTKLNLQAYFSFYYMLGTIYIEVGQNIRDHHSCIQDQGQGHYGEASLQKL